MVNIYSDLHRYNANYAARNTGDCVKRSISMAFGIPYIQVSRELNAYARNHYGGASYKYKYVFSGYIKSKGIVSDGPAMDYGLESDCNVEEFCRIYPSGTYLLSVGRPDKNIPDHLVCIINGDVWDSWDSTKDVVYHIFVVEEGSSAIEDTLDVDDINEEIISRISKYCANAQKTRVPFVRSWVITPHKYDKYTIANVLDVKFQDKIYQDLGWKAWDGIRVVTKLHPKLSREENIKTILDNYIPKIREWILEFNNSVKYAYLDKEIKPNPRFVGDRYWLVRLPKWAIPYVIQLYSYKTLDRVERWYLLMDKLEDDPYNSNVIEFYAKTFARLKKFIEHYRNTYDVMDETTEDVDFYTD